MKKTFFMYFILLLYLELFFHVACFSEIDFFSTIFIVLFSLIFATVFTIVTSLFRRKRLNSLIFKIFAFLLIIIFCSELVYYKIYESFFNISGIVFVGAIKDGYDKVLITIWQNIIYILLFLIPLIIIFAKIPKRLSRINKKDFSVLLVLSCLAFGYISVMVNFIDNSNAYSYYNLLHNINLPVLNVKNFGLITSSSISLKRNFFGFNSTTIKSEDILINKRTSLSEDMKIEYNEENIYFDELISNEENTEVRNLHNYFANQIPTNKNDFTGIFKDKNVIFIIAESFDEIAIDANLTPTLYKLKNEGIKFNNYFAPKYPASTADGEYMLEWGILPIIGENYSLIDMVYNSNPYILPRVLKNSGYNTYVYHNYFGYYNYRKKYFSTLDFDGYRYCQDGISMRCENFHGSDVDMMEQTPQDFINQGKFFAYYITLSGHGSYDSSNFVACKHISKLDGYKMSSSLKYYMAAHIDFDIAMEKLITSLEEANKLDDTVIIISSDHSPYYLTNGEVNSLSSIDRNNKFDRNRGSLIIYNSNLSKSYEVDKYAMNIDVLPTILNMLGVTYDSRLIIGKDIMSTNNDGVVIFPDRSWVNNYGSYDSISLKFTPFVDNIDSKYVSQITQEVNDKYQVSVSMQYNDYYKYVFK